MTTHQLKPTAFGILIGHTRMSVGRMEKGAYDFTLTDIEKLSEVLGISFDALIQPKKAA
jgi:uncharacterized protein YaiE (UPF0345 family)